MVTPVSKKPIFATIPSRVISQLKGLSSIDSFTFGKQNLRPAIVELFKKREVEIGEVYLDNPARVRMMGMMPSFADRVAEGNTPEELFSILELSLFSTKSQPGMQALYVLGDKKNLGAINTDKNRSAKAKVVDSNNVKRIQIELPEMIQISPRVRIMEDAVSVRLFKQVMRNYEPKGRDAELLLEFLRDPAQKNNTLNYVNLFDAREFAKRLSDLTGRKFRVQTEKEWKAAREKLRGLDFTWTETRRNKRFENLFVLRNVFGGRRFGDFAQSDPNARRYNFAIRLVEDI